MQQLIDRLAAFAPVRLLDVGCGDGAVTRRLVDGLPTVTRLVGVDRDPVALDEAGDRLQGLAPEVSWTLVEASAAELPCDGASFDAVTCSDLLHHLDDLPAALAEMRRMLRPGGVLLVRELIRDVATGAEETGRDLHHLKAWIDRIAGVPHGETLSAERVLTAVRDAGFVIGWTEREHHDPFDPGLPEAAQWIADERDHLEDYLRFAEDSPDYPRIRRTAARLFHRMESAGFAFQPSLIVLAHKPDDHADRGKSVDGGRSGCVPFTHHETSFRSTRADRRSSH